MDLFFISNVFHEIFKNLNIEQYREFKYYNRAGKKTRFLEKSSVPSPLNQTRAARCLIAYWILALFSSSVV